jgi:hypothetical protein
LISIRWYTTTNMMKKIIKHTFILLFIFASTILAGLTYDSPFSTYNEFVPQGTDKYNVFTFSLQATGSDESLNKILIKNTSDDVEFNAGIGAVYLYLDEDKSGSLDTTTDSLLSSQSFSSNTSSATLSLTDDDGETITTENSKFFIIAYDVDVDAELASFANITLTTIETGSTSLDLSAITDSDTPTVNNIAITGVTELRVDTSAIPDIAIPGQDGVAMIYFSVELSGTDENNGETVDNDDIIITIENSESNFITDDSDNGITALYLYHENIPVYTDADREFNENTVTLIKKISSFTDNSTVSINITSSQRSFTEIGFGSSNTENYWIIYDVGDDTSVTDNTIISAQITSFEGLGSKSEEYLIWPIDSNDVPDASEVNVAGLTLVELESIVPSDNVYGANTSAPILSFKLRSNHTASTLNTVTLLNPGSTGYVVNGLVDGVTEIEMYQDTDRNNSFDKNTDIRVAYKNLSDEADNTATQVLINIEYEGTPTHDGVLIEEFDSDADETVGYFGNNDSVFFVVYHFGVGIEDSGTAIARLGNSAASVNILLNDFGDEEVIGITLSDVDNTTPATANPEAEIDISSETNLSVEEVLEIAPESVIEGQIKVPMLSITLQSTASFPSTSFTILNPFDTFLENNRGVTQVWVYKEDANLVNYELDDTDTFENAISTFDDTSKAIINGISIDNGDNYFLVLYDFGMNSTEKTEKIQAQLSTIEGSETNDTTLILAGNLPAPTVPNSVAVEEAFIESISIAVSKIDDDDTTSYNVTISVTNNTEEIIILESIAPKTYLDDISGNDISYQFTSTLTSDIEFPYPLAVDAKLSAVYILGHNIQLSDGSAVIDTYIEYQATSTMNAKRERYLGTSDEWIAAVEEEKSIDLTGSDTIEYYEFPSHIEDVNIIRTSITIDFEQFNSIKTGDDFTVEFKDNGSFISESSIAILLNDVSLTNSDYSYNSTTGLLTIEEIGTSDGTITIEVNDTIGNALDTSYIYFSLNSVELELITPLFYPNPYIMGETDLTLGFNVTQESVTIEYYLYDHNGVRVHSGSESFSDIGYNTIEFDVNDSYLAPGIYILKMVGTTDDGLKSTAKARLAIY